jgi:O-antigen ligase
MASAADTADGGDSRWGGVALRSTLLFLSVPAMLAVAIVFLDIRLPGWALYGIAAVLGLLLLGRVMRDPEWLLALFVIYIPLNKIYVAPVAPGINGTNALLLLMLFAWAVQTSRAEGASRTPKIASTLAGLYAAVTLVSVVTAVITLGTGYVMSRLGDVKAWIDQFIVFYAFLYLIRDGRMARRVVVYMMLGTLVTLALGFQEWLDKRTYDSIEKARVLGPQLQPNDYGAFLAYSCAPFIALFLANTWRIRAWLTVPPFFLLLAKVLLATFSRGAYLAMGFAGVVAGYVRGKMFLVGAGVLAVGLLVAMPELVPESLMERMSQTTSDTGATEELDASSQTRLILWEAAMEMTLESPVFGKGFKTFPALKGQYTDYDVHESDNHNMYLYLSSQMGIPAVLLFVLLLWKMYSLGVRIYRNADEPFARTVGLAATAMAAAVAMTNMFGSRMVDIAVTAYFWVMLAVLAHLWSEIEQRSGTEGAR